jgi:hypothetical protein
MVGLWEGKQKQGVMFGGVQKPVLYVVAECTNNILLFPLVVS